MKKILCLFLLVMIGMGLCGCEEEPMQPVEQNIDPVTESKATLEMAYNLCCDWGRGFAWLSNDGTCLVIDTNPKDESFYPHQEDACTAISICNAYLQFPASITDKMSATRAVDGMQSESFGDFMVTWTYHPDCGLKVIYELNLF